MPSQLRLLPRQLPLKGELFARREKMQNSVLRAQGIFDRIKISEMGAGIARK